MYTFNGTVAPSTIQPGAGTVKNKNPIGNARIFNTFHPDSISMQAAMTGNSDKTSTDIKSCVRAIKSMANPTSNTAQPTTGAGTISAFANRPRLAHTSQMDAATINGPCPSCSVCQGPLI